MELLAVVILVFLVWWLQGLVFKKNALKHVDYTCAFSKDEVTEGDSIELVETLANRKFLPVPWLKAEITTSRWLEFAQRKSVITGETRFIPSVFYMGSFRETVRRWRVDCVKRGVFRLGRVDLVTGDLLGSASMDRTVHLNEMVTVLPRLVDIDAEFVNLRHLTGDTVTKRRLLEDPFLISGVREYTDRDSMNKIHWGLTARQGQIMVRNNDFTTSQTITVLLNIQSMPGEQGKAVKAEAAEQGIRVCATLVHRAAGQGIPVRFGVNTSIDGKRGTLLTGEISSGEGAMEMMRLMARLPLESTQDIGFFLEEVEGTVDSSDVVVVTPFLSDSILAFYDSMQARQANVAIYVIGFVDAPEKLGDYQIYSTGNYPGETQGKTEAAG